MRWFPAILSLLLIVGGVGMMGVSSHIQDEIEYQKGRAKSQVDTVTGSPLWNKAGSGGKQASQVAGSVAHGEIDARARAYYWMVDGAYYVGVGLIIAGGALFALSFLPKKR